MPGHRWAAILLTLIVTALSIAVPVSPAHAATPCSLEEWREPGKLTDCVSRLQAVSSSRATCLKSPTPSAPDSGMAGWFASRPESSRKPGVTGLYSKYGYAGYDFTTYDINCVQTTMHPDYKFENTVANGEFMIATGIVGASNALRERAWEPKELWGWADPLVEKATKAVYTKVFTVFGALTLAVVGLYLLWRSRQSDMSATMTTAGWAMFVLVVVTALATWPTKAAGLADATLTNGLAAVHSAIGPATREIPQDKCPQPNPEACKDNRPPAVRAGDTAAENLLYKNWLRGTLGSADSVTAQKYGMALYDAKSFSWAEVEKMRKEPSQRAAIITQKSDEWQRVAEQIKTEDPEAYEYLQGMRGTDRIGAGFVAILASLAYSFFDITASVLVLLGFVLFRWAVIAAPVIGTVALLKPASAGFRRLMNAVLAAVFNILIFGTGAAIYLFAVDQIMGTAALPGWLQVVLIWLCGVVGWMLLRPYRRITQMAGKEAGASAPGASWRERFFSDLRSAAVAAGTAKAVAEDDKAPSTSTGAAARVETRAEEVSAAPSAPVAQPASSRPESTSAPVRSTSERRLPAPMAAESIDSTWGEVYRPSESRSEERV
ncbi:MFS transporter [Longispora sp. K20-0274]|uniref:MFS transporter n=1 Tax=Longispora sp. K20-0274 TaxID=3088255 RepID=UPI00399C043C